MMSSLFAKLQRKPNVTFPEPRSDAPLAVIGDIHGCLSLLERLLAKLPNGVPVVCVGDYVDRGPDSLDTLRYLKEHENITCLMGNHEEMLLGFLADPGKEAGRWLRNGGLETLAYSGIAHKAGLTSNPETWTTDALQTASDLLVEKMGDALVDWLGTRPLIHQSGNIVIVHAALDPKEPIPEFDLQRPVPQTMRQTYLWGHPDFFTTARSDGWWVAHGHTIMHQPVIAEGRISLDTGAYATEVLTGAILSPEDVEVISA